MPLPKPGDSETHDEFIGRCMADETMNNEYPESDQRYAVCQSQWEGRRRGHTMNVLFKGESGYEAKEVSDQELLVWFKEHTKDGIVEDEIVIFHDAEVKADGSRVRFVFSDGSMDSDFERIDPTGWQLKGYRKNPIVLWSHDWMRPAIGRSEKVKKTDKDLSGSVVFDESGLDPFAMMIANKVRSGIITKGSVGFKPLRIELVEDKKDPTRLIHREQELMEFSIVNIPANLNAGVVEDSADDEETDTAIAVLGAALEESEGLAKNTIFGYIHTEQERETSAEDNPSPETVDEPSQLSNLFRRKPIGDIFS
jgi:HK97 family phage prohead protease